MTDVNKLARIQECVAAIKNGRCSTEALLALGFSHGCIESARRFIDVECGPYNANNSPVGARRANGSD